MAIVIPERQVRTNTSPVKQRGTYKTADDFGGQAFTQLEQTANQNLQLQQQMAQKRKRENDLAFVEGADNELNAWNNDALIKLQENKGKNAPAAAQAYRKAYEAKVNELKSTLRDPDQQFAFSSITGKSLVTAQSTADNYAVKEMDAFHEAEHGAFIENNTNNAIRGYQNSGVVDDSIGRSIDATRAYLIGKGSSDEVITQKVAQLKSLSYTGVVRAAVEGEDYGLAKNYLAKFGDQIDPATRGQLEEMVDMGESEVRGQTHTDNLMALGLSKSETLAKAREMLSGKDEDGVVSRIKVRFAEKESAEVLSNKKLSFDAYTQLKNGNDIDVASQLNLTNAARKSLTEYKNIIRTGGTVENSGDALKTLDSIFTKDKTVFMNTDLIEYRSKLDDDTFKRYESLQSEMIKLSKDGKPFTSASIFTEKEMLVNAAADFGVTKDGTKPSDSDSKEDRDYYRRYVTEANRRIMKKESAKGAKLDDEEKEVIIQQTAAWFTLEETVTERGTIWNSTRRPSEITADMLEKNDYLVPVKGIPFETAISITEQLVARGIAPTKENIATAFDKGLK